jgi:hypothetical protein
MSTVRESEERMVRKEFHRSRGQPWLETPTYPSFKRFQLLSQVLISAVLSVCEPL